MRLSQPRGKLDFIDDISGIRHPRAIASYTFCPLFVMLIACHLSDLGAIATAAPLFFDLADAVYDPAKIRVFVWIQRAFPVFWAEKRVGEGGFLLTKVNTRVGERRRGDLRWAYLWGCNMLSSSWLYGGWGLGIDVGGVGGIVTCYMLHVTCNIKRSRNSRKGVKK